MRWCPVYLGLISALLVGEGGARRPTILRAQTPAESGRLTVRPRPMATGQQNPRSGEYELDSLENVLVYVPEPCAGPRRCPLVVFLHSEVDSARTVIEAQRPLANQYGMLLLAPDDITPSSGTLDAAMAQVLQRFAVDPEKIALAGESVGGMGTLLFGRQNFEVFSRLAPLSPAYARPIPYLPPPPLEDYPRDTSRGPQNRHTQFYISAGIGELPADVHTALAVAQRERQAGQAVKVVLDFRLHQTRQQDLDHLWRWLRDSWTPSNTAAPTPSPVGAPAVPLLTAEALTQLATFWTGFQARPDSIRRTARQPSHKESVLAVGREPISIFGPDIPALATADAPVAATLKAAGLTAEEEEAYRIAFLSAWVTSYVVKSPTDPTSVLGKNAALVREYRLASKALVDLLGAPRCEASALAIFEEC